MGIKRVTGPGMAPEQMLFCQSATTASAAGVSMLSGMPVPSPVSHVKQQAEAEIAALKAKLAAAEAIVAVLQPPATREPNPFVNALAAWPGRGGVDQWSGMPLSVGRWVK